MQKIAIIEISGHFEVMYAVCQQLCADFMLSVFTTELAEREFIPLVKDKIIQFHLKSDIQSDLEYLKSIQSILKGFDWLIFITIENNYGKYAEITSHAKSIMIAHNGNFWVDYFPSIRIRTPKDVLRLGKALVWLEPMHKSRILENLDFVSFPTPQIAKHFVDNKKVKPEKIFPSFPFFYQSSKRVAEKTRELKIVIPGTISNASREYRMVWDALEKLKKMLPARPVVVYLLGVPIGRTGRKIQQNFQRLEGKDIQLRIFANRVAQKTYDEMLVSAEVIVLPLKRKMEYGICEELAGNTKISGSVYDVVRLGKRAFLPVDYELEPELGDYFEFYSSPDELRSKMLLMAEGNLKNLSPENGVFMEIYQTRKEEIVRLLKN